MSAILSSHQDNASFLRELAENLPPSAKTPERVELLRRLAQREEQQATFARDALAAWDEYQRSGLHLNAEEADKWLARLEAGEDAEIPKCHH